MFVTQQNFGLYVDKDGKFVGFISWNLCFQNVMEGVLYDKWMLLDIEEL